MMRIFLWLWLAGIPCLLLAQSSPPVRPHWQIGLGYGQTLTLDQQVSPLLYQAHTGLISLQLAQDLPHHHWETGLQLAVGSNQSRRFGQRIGYVIDPADIYGQQDSIQYVLNPGFSYGQIQAHYAHCWKLSPQALNVYLGFRAEEVFRYAGIGADTWFLNQLALSPALHLATLPASWGRLEAALSTALLAHLVRLPYAKDPSLPNERVWWTFVQTGSSLATPLRFQQVQLELNYFLPLTSRREIGLSYQFDWMRHAPPTHQPLAALSHSLQLTYSF